jgi:uncharacterized Zn finger protein (UPF0148 family)
MFCRWCGTQLPEGAVNCPSCSKPTSVPSDNRAAESDSFDRVVAETTRAARELTAAAARLTERLAKNMQATADDPKGTATRAARRVARDLDAAREEIEKALRDL